MNIFNEQPEFIELDPRKHRKTGYAVTPEFMLTRHQAMLPPGLIQGKRILDLGSCLAGTGAWCLSNGASFYKGIELDDEFVRNSIFCLNKYYPPDSWSVSKISIEEFLATQNERYDIVVASGILYGSHDPLKLLESFAKTADFIVIESMQTQTIFHQKILSEETMKVIARDPRIAEFLESASYIAVGDRGMVASGNKTLKFAGLNPSMAAIIYLMNQLGFEHSAKPYRQLQKALPKEYAPFKRFALHFRKNPNLKVRKLGLENSVSDHANLVAVEDWRS